MWHLLKAEYSYYRDNLYITVIAYILFVLGFIVCIVKDSQIIKYQHVIHATLIPAMIATLSMLHSKNTAKRDRILALLPVTQYHIALARVLYADIVYLGLVFFFWIIPLVAKLVDFNSMTVIVMIFFTGCFLIINALYFIGEDVKYCFTDKTFNFFRTKKILFVFFNAGISLFWFYTFIMPYDFFFGLYKPYLVPLNPVVFSAAGLFIFNVAGLGLSYLSIRTYIRRKSYLV